ncbi:MAG: M23 family metallopeptidase [Kiritimatiellae bacterium]|nr:M23 family metallopeptidase [Kiritimatiellia bacterium]
MKLRRHSRHLYWIVPLLVADIFLFSWLKERGARLAAERNNVMVPQPAGPEPAVVFAAPWKDMVFPTDEARLLDADPAAAYQPTASGRPESALFGTVRTAKVGKRLMPSFHEGIDIAVLKRDRRGRPLDKVYAVADGTVGYINRHAGNSNYGIYIVLLHDDPLGEVYTLYSHLARVEPGLKPGAPVTAGQEIGTVGNTSSSPMPMARAHLHFEIGLLVQSRFADWHRSKKLKPDHKSFHGHNLIGVDPRAFFTRQKADPNLDFATFLALQPVAFRVVLAARRKPDFFRRYPALWHGAEFSGGAVVLDCTANGLPLRGRAATEEERAKLGRRKSAVLMADETVLGRNGSRIIVHASPTWKLGPNGETWREVILY